MSDFTKHGDTTSSAPTYADLRSEWAAAPAEYCQRGDTECLRILGAPVMEDWEAPYMAALADVACSRGGRVLEVGFGLGLSAYAIDAFGDMGGDEGQQQPRVTEHVIIEANKDVACEARRFAATARIPTVVIEDFWQQAAESLPSSSFDGVLFDVFPLARQEVIDGECASFYATAARLLKPAGLFTFYYDVADSWVTTRRLFESEVAAQLRALGFASVEAREDVVLAEGPPPGCDYFWKDRFLVPACVRGAS